MQRVTLENETKVGLLYALKDFTTETVKDLLMPVKRQKQDEREPKRRAAAVFLAPSFHYVSQGSNSSYQVW